MCDKQPCSDSIRFWSLNQANLLPRLAFVPGPTQTQRWGDTRREGGVGVTGASQALQGRSARPRTERPSIPADSGARTKHLGAGGPASSSQLPSLRNEAASRGCARRSARAPSGGAAGATARPRREHVSTRLCLRGTCALTEAGGAAFSFAMALSGVPRPPFLKKLSEV